MPSLSADDVIFELSTELKSLEDQRAAAARRQSRTLWTLGILTVLIAGIGLVAIRHAGLVLLFGGVLWLIVAGAIYHFAAGTHVSAYKDGFKTQIVGKIARLMHPEMHYSPGYGISAAEFAYPNLFDRRADRYRCEDGFRGMVGKTSVKFSEVRAQYKTTSTDSKGRRRTSYHTFFDGIFMIADFHKHFRGQLRVLPDTAEKFLGFLGKKLQGFRPFSGDDLVYLEDAAFEKEFVVYGTDQVEARYILSTAMLARILDLRQKWGEEVRLGFLDSSVFIAISYRGNLIEPDHRRPAADRAQIQRFIEELALCFAIVDDLSLNTRVWTKE